MMMKVKNVLCLPSAGPRKQKKLTELRLILLGKTGVGKSAAGNSILGTAAFRSELSPTSLTDECARQRADVGGRKVAVVDTPGLFDTKFGEEEVLQKIKKSMSLSAPGPHAFLLVLRLGRFTQEEKDTVRMIQTFFGEDSLNYTMLLFTHGDKLKRQTIQEFISKSEDLKDLVQVCCCRYHVFNNTVEDPSQVDGLLAKIDTMIGQNGGKHYTAKMFKRAVKERKMYHRILRKQQKLEEQQRKEELQAELRNEMGSSPVEVLAQNPSKKDKCLLQ